MLPVRREQVTRLEPEGCQSRSESRAGKGLVQIRRDDRFWRSCDGTSKDLLLRSQRQQDEEDHEEAVTYQRPNSHWRDSWGRHAEGFASCFYCRTKTLYFSHSVTVSQIRSFLCQSDTFNRQIRQQISPPFGPRYPCHLRSWHISIRG